MSEKYMAGSGFIVVGLVAAVVLKWCGLEEWDAINYGLIIGAALLAVLMVSIPVGLIIYWLMRSDPKL